MLDSIFKDAATASLTNLTLGSFLGALIAAVVLGFALCLLYMFTNKKEGYSQSYVWSIMMICPIVCVIISVIGNSIGASLSLAGALSLVRFRSAPGDPKQITYVFCSVATGLICGLGYIAYAVIFLVIVGAILVALNRSRFAAPKTSSMTLKVTIPENLNYIGLFDKTLNRYTSSWMLKRVKTTEFGTLFELIYSIEINNSANQKEFIDELRTLNGNLNVILVLYKYDDKVYAN